MKYHTAMLQTLQRLMMVAAVLSLSSCESPAHPPVASAGGYVAPINWVDWSDAAFSQAKREHKFVILDLEAVWCHWCHVMDQTTYNDPQVKQLIGNQYIAIRVDQDSRPDISARYEDFGWPATVVFAPDGSEIVKRQGYVNPAQMVAMLNAINRDPTPGPSVEKASAITANDAGALSVEVRKTLVDRLNKTYDDRMGSWGTTQKFMSWDNVEYCLVHSNDERYKTMARQTLTAQLQLLDPVWGGVYQYSTDGDWNHPHFEKIMQMQAENLRVYSQAFALWHDDADLHTAQAIQNFVKNFLTHPDGMFFTSQDADFRFGQHSADYFALDDAHRRALGIPRIDTSIYARENGWMIGALAEMYAATGDADALADARRAALYMISKRRLSDGGFSHDAHDVAGPYLGDTLAMGRAFLSLYTVTADIRWLNHASTSAAFIDKHFRSDVGFNTAAGATSAPSFEENVTLARFANLLSHYTGNTMQRKIAEHAMQYLTSPQVATRRGVSVGALLLADRELSQDPLHLSVVGSWDAPESQQLFHAAIGYFDQYKRVDFVDPKQDAPPNIDVQFPKLSKPAAFLCTQTSCSAPMYDPSRLRDRLAKQTP